MALKIPCLLCCCESVSPVRPEDTLELNHQVPVWMRARAVTRMQVQAVLVAKVRTAGHVSLGLQNTEVRVYKRQVEGTLNITIEPLCSL